VVKLLANPLVLRAVVVLVCAGFAFLFGLLSVKLLRSKLSENEFEEAAARSTEALPMHVYNTVIQQLKQQKHELMVQSQSEQLRARASENFSQAVLSNLSCGVLVFGANGLVKSLNPAAKSILGFASGVGMSADGIFRGASVRPARRGATEAALADEVHSVLREGGKRRQVEAEYVSPAQQKHSLAVTISPVSAPDGALIGAACLIHDVTELEQIRRQQQLQVEMSAEMALQLRTSLATISSYAQQLADRPDARVAQQLAKDIAQEASQLDRSIGGFLASQRPQQMAASSVGD
jgi:nitrogen fixation/metabolism regulation signal transduction histidine kinase